MQLQCLSVYATGIVSPKTGSPSVQNTSAHLPIVLSTLPQSSENESGQTKAVWWMDPLVLTAIFTAISGGAAFVSTLFLLKSFKNQDRLLRLQIEALQLQFKSKLQEHYGKIKEGIVRFKEINDGTITQAEKTNFDWRSKHWGSIILDWKGISYINQNHRSAAKSHVLKQISNFDKKIEDIDEKIAQYNKQVLELETDLTTEVKNRFEKSGIRLTENGKEPYLMLELEVYWFEEILPDYLRGRDLDSIYSKLTDIQKKYNIKVESYGNEQDGIWFPSNQMSHAPANKEIFIQVSNELIREKPIIKKIAKLIDKKIKIAEPIREINEDLDKIISEIETNKYDLKLECCE